MLNYGFTCKNIFAMHRSVYWCAQSLEVHVQAWDSIHGLAFVFVESLDREQEKETVL